MMKIITSIFTIYQLSLFSSSSSISSRRLLQLQIPPSIPAASLGYYNQECTIPQPDFKCTSGAQPGIILTDKSTKKIECGVDHSCCMCRTILCGHPAMPNCDTVSINGNFGAYGVQDIQIYGPPVQGAFVDCGGPFACAGTIIYGNNMNTIGCSADNACSYAIMMFENSKGIICGQRGCMGAKIKMSSNNGGSITCAGPQSCADAHIDISGITNLGCNGNKACQNSIITVTNPILGFSLICNGDYSCENMKLELSIPEPIEGCPMASAGLFRAFVDWKGITCGSPEACKGMELTVVNNGCAPIRIEDLECSPNQACVGAVFNLEAGTGPFAQWIELTNCKCSAISCAQATGIDRCYNNLRQFTCPDVRSCYGLTETISNPANGFKIYCPGEESCMGLIANVLIAGASRNLVQTMAGIHCGGISACNGAMISFFNTQLNHIGHDVPISVKSVECLSSKSCKDLTIITGPNVIIEHVLCANIIGDECSNCVIKQYANDLIGRPCDPNPPQQTTPSLPIPPSPV